MYKVQTLYCAVQRLSSVTAHWIVYIYTYSLSSTLPICIDFSFKVLCVCVCGFFFGRGEGRGGGMYGGRCWPRLISFPSPGCGLLFALWLSSSSEMLFLGDETWRRVGNCFGNRFEKWIDRIFLSPFIRSFFLSSFSLFRFFLSLA